MATCYICGCPEEEHNQVEMICTGCGEECEFEPGEDIDEEDDLDDQFLLTGDILDDEDDEY